MVHEYLSNRDVTWGCTYHVVWCTKYLRAVLEPVIASRLREIVREVADERGAQVDGLLVTPHSVQLTVRVDPQFGIHRLVKRIKSRSSNLLRKEFPSLKSRIPTLWTNAYHVSTVGKVSPRIVERYIEGQRTV